MVIKGKSRGNGAQLAVYLMRVADNDNVRVFDIRGTSQVDDLKASLIEMSLTSELTKSEKGLFHAQINPAYGEDKKMTHADWLNAADTLEEELSMNGQKRVIVLHEKKNRIHAHVVWERYDHEKGIMITDSFSGLAQDRARKTMEQKFGHERTPVRNLKRPEMKQVLSDLWQKTVTGKEFVKEAFQKGYMIAKGQLRRPYMVVDDTGRSFDLTRQLKGVKTKEVSEKLHKEKLPLEKDAIKACRDRQKELEMEKQFKAPIEQEKGHWVDQYKKKEETMLQQHQETIRERMIREMKEQLEAQRQKIRERGR
ncbi:MAG: relaxase [Chitinophagaceae bacterium]